MPIEVIDEIVPKNDGDFPLMKARHIKMPNGERLTEALAEKPKPVAIDLSFIGPDSENNGMIIETYEDGTTKETKLTYDTEGNITEIEDADGHKTTLVWPSK